MTPCEIVQDLMPLVIDEVASDDSRRIVSEHLKSCAQCRKKYESLHMHSELPSTNKHILKRLRVQLFTKELLMVCIGAMLITFIQTIEPLRYTNILLLILIGMFDYFLLAKKWYYATILMAICLCVNSIFLSWFTIGFVFLSYAVFVCYAMVFMLLGTLFAALLAYVMQLRKRKE